MPAVLSPDRWPDVDDQDLPSAESRARLTAIRVTAVTAVLVGMGYLTWRCVATVPGASWWLAWPLLLLEVHAMVTFLLYLHVLWQPGSAAAPQPVRGSGPSVTVLVPTYNEPSEVLLPTLAAAAALREAEEVWVLDDGDRGWVREMAAGLGVVYRARSTHEHAKAGNINAALPDVTTDLVAVLDADHVVRADFLANVLGYFADPALALVQTPQSFYNTDSFEHMHTRGGPYCEQDLFYRLLAEARNRWGAAFWCGTNSVVRVAALRDVGGVATETVTEDIHTSIRLHRGGWKTVYHNEVLARGLAASNSEQYLNQRLRWGTGAMQVLRNDNPLIVRGLTWQQRLAYASTLLGWFDSWRTLGFIALPIATVLTGGLPANAPVTTFLALFTANWAVQRIAIQALARGRAPLWPSTVFEFVRMPAALKATTALASARPRPFSVTDKGRTDGDRHPMPAPRLLVMLLVSTFLSGVWYLATVVELTPLTYRIPWVAHASMLWVLFNAAFLAGALYRIKSARFGSERRASVRFPMSGTARINEDTATVKDLSITGAQILTPSPVETGALVRLDLAPLVHQHVQAIVRSARAVGDRYLLGLEFAEMTPQARGSLALQLFQTGSAPTFADSHLTLIPGGAWSRPLAAIRRRAVPA
jgi:cellulose synthase/poly-beta-1,6-N-acetylglucosamine synthase-like glycosyltransferase